MNMNNKFIIWFRDHNLLNKKLWYAIILLDISFGTLMIVFPMYLCTIADQMIEKKTTVSGFLPALVTLIAISLIYFMKSYFTSREMVKLEYSIKTGLFNGLIKAKYSLFQKLDYSTVFQIICNETNNISSYYFNSIPDFVCNIIVYITMNCFILRITYRFIYLQVILALLYTIVSIILLPKLKQQKEKLTTCQNEYFSKILRDLEDTRTIKLFVLYDKIRVSLQKSVLKIINHTLKMVNIEITLKALISSLRYIFILYVLIFIILRGQKITVYILMEQYIEYFIRILYSTTSFFESRQKHSVVTSTLSEFILDSEKGLLITNDYINKIEIKKINFSYYNNNSDSYHNLFYNFSYQFKNGNCYLLKGPNGQGKSTLLDLLLGLQIPDQGKIYYNSCDMELLNKASLRNKIAYVAQQPYFVDTDDHNEINVINCLDDRRCVQYCNRLGLDIENIREYSISEFNDCLSGGQKRKVAILNAILLLEFRVSSILIMDEPCNDLDSESIKQLITIIKEKKKNAIVIIVSHDNYFDDIADEVIDLSTKTTMEVDHA